MKGVGSNKSSAIVKAELKSRNSKEPGESGKSQKEELRVEFDLFEFMTASKRSLIFEQIYLKPYHRVLIPHVLYSLSASVKNSKNQKNSNNFRNVSLFYKRALRNVNQSPRKEFQRVPGTVSLGDKLHETFMKILELEGISVGGGIAQIGIQGDSHKALSDFGNFGKAHNPQVILCSQEG